MQNSFPDWISRARSWRPCRPPLRIPIGRAPGTRWPSTCATGGRRVGSWLARRRPQIANRDADAESILAHRLSSIGIEWQFGEAIDWSFNPTTQPGSKWPRNHEWTWQLSRHPMWLALARAFSATGDEKYAREFVAELKSWVHDCPVPLDKAANVPFSRWRTIEAGIRAGTVWPRRVPPLPGRQSI